MDDRPKKFTCLCAKSKDKKGAREIKVSDVDSTKYFRVQMSGVTHASGNCHVGCLIACSSLIRLGSSASSATLIVVAIHPAASVIMVTTTTSGARSVF